MTMKPTSRGGSDLIQFTDCPWASLAKVDDVAIIKTPAGDVEYEILLIGTSRFSNYRSKVGLAQAL